MLVLVDYDNIEPVDRATGPKPVLARIAEAICASLPARPQRMAFRLYGGWYDRTGPTRLAQSLAIALQRNFPYPHVAPGVANALPIILQAELAYAQLIDPSRHLLHTYRDRSCPDRLRAEPPLSHGCPIAHAQTCGLRHLPAFLRTGSCPERSCSVKLTDVVFRGEQKLVDMMLATDLLFRATHYPAEPIAVVSSDQDLWPAMRQALASAKSLKHVHTKPGMRTPAHYSSSAGTAYSELSF